MFTAWPVDSLNGITDTIRKHKQIEWMHVRHEEAAAFAAGAESQLTGEIAVCAGSCGPGNLHLINGLYDCHRSRVPVLAGGARPGGQASAEPQWSGAVGCSGEPSGALDATDDERRAGQGFSLYMLRAVLSGKGDEVIDLAKIEPLSLNCRVAHSSPLLA